MLKYIFGRNSEPKQSVNARAEEEGEEQWEQFIAAFCQALKSMNRSSNVHPPDPFTPEADMIMLAQDQLLNELFLDARNNLMEADECLQALQDLWPSKQAGLNRLRSAIKEYRAGLDAIVAMHVQTRPDQGDIDPDVARYLVKQMRYTLAKGDKLFGEGQGLIGRVIDLTSSQIL